MNKKICKKVLEHKDNFIPHIFTNRQINIIEKYLKGNKLNNTEKSYLYSTIKKKIDALQLLREEFYVKGSEMITERIIKAKKILKEINNEKAFISGSFLYLKKYNDIDVYIISKKRKQYHKGKLHFVHITENDLRKPIFLSAMKYSVANFSKEIKPIIERPMFDDLIFTYQLAIKEVLEKDDQKTVREIIFEYHKQITNQILDSYSLYKQWQETIKKTKKQKIEQINKMTKELILKLYSSKYMYQTILPYKKNIETLIPEYKVNNNLIVYNHFLEEVKNECRKAQT